MGLGFIVVSFILNYFTSFGFSQSLLLMLEIIGYIILTKRVKHRFVPFLLLISTLFFISTFIESIEKYVSFFVLIALMRKILFYKMVYDISDGYTKRKQYLIAIIFYLIINGGFYSYMFIHGLTQYNFQNPIYGYLLVALEIYLMYHLLKINNYLYASLDEPVLHYSRRTKNKKRIAFVGLILGVLGFSLFKGPYLNKEIEIQNQTWFALYGQDPNGLLIVDGMGGYANDYRPFGQVYLPQVYLSYDIRHAAKKIYAEILFQDEVLASILNDRIKVHPYVNQTSRKYEYHKIENYLFIDMQMWDSYFDDFPGHLRNDSETFHKFFGPRERVYISEKRINDYLSHINDFTFKYILYDENDHILVESSFSLENKIDQELYYRDDTIELSNMFITKENHVIKMPDLKIQKNHAYSEICVYLVNEQGNRIDKSQVYYLIGTNQKLFETREPEITYVALPYTKLMIDFYDQNGKVIETKEISMEVLHETSL